MPSYGTASRTGIHSDFPLDLFSEREQSILQHLGREWYITHGGQVNIASSIYKYFLMRPTTLYKEMFNLEREIIAVFSSYPAFEPRTLDAFDKVKESIQELRIENVCRVLISDDPEISIRIENILKSDPEQPIVIPFSYSELTASYDDFFIRNRFRNHFYSRDLFSFFSPLKKDLYFFGRSELVQDLVNRHKSGEHIGLFGLRKSGKTSIIYAVERVLNLQDERFVSIDCELPSIHKLRWNELLHRVATEYHQSRNSRLPKPNAEAYTEKGAADAFHADIFSAYRSKKAQPVLIMFDEIERISPRTAASSHWREGDDFVYFWQTLRGFYQRNPEIFTYMIVGTNPSCIELSMISGHENPLFGSIPYLYVPSFSVDQVRQMVRKLGRYMGLKFDELIYAKLTDDYGGHPFLIRQMCSAINASCKGDRPANIDKALYERVTKEFEIISLDYMEMIVQVLRDHYPDEFEMLTLLALGEFDLFGAFAADHERYTKHLIGYGLLHKSENGLSFNVEAIKLFLQKQHRYQRVNLTEDERIAEVSERRNKIEKGLRVLIKNTLKSRHGKKEAGKRVAGAIPESRRRSLATDDIEVLLSRDKSPLFFLDLINIVKREWDDLKNIFDMEKNKVVVMLEDINDYGRSDAHANDVSGDDFTQLRLYFAKLEKLLQEWS